MTKISGILNKPVLALNGARICGVVNNAYFDKNIKNLAYFSITTDENPQMLVSAQDIISCSDAVVVDSAAVLKYPYDADLSELLSDIIGKGAYLPSGTLKGEVADIILSQSFRVLKLLLKKSGDKATRDGAETEITPSQIAEVSDYLLLKSTAKPKSKKPRIPRPEKDYPVRIIGDFDAPAAGGVLSSDTAVDADFVNDIMTDSTETNGITAQGNGRLSQNNEAASNAQAASLRTDDASPAERLTKNSQKTDGASELNMESFSGKSSVFASAQEVIPEAPIALNPDSREPVLTHDAFRMLLEGDSAEYDEDAHTPTRIICDYEFLLGRTLGADLNTYLNEPIAKKGDEVTSEIVEKARRAGKLVELTLNSVKNAK